jgi:hypothetical protein
LTGLWICGPCRRRAGRTARRRDGPAVVGVAGGQELTTRRRPSGVLSQTARARRVDDGCAAHPPLSASSRAAGGAARSGAGVRRNGFVAGQPGEFAAQAGVAHAEALGLAEAELAEQDGRGHRLRQA